MRKVRLVILLVFYCSILFSQSSKIDSLNKFILGAKEDSNKVKAYIKLSAVYMQSQPEKALQIAKTANKLAEKVKFSYGKTEALYQIAYYYYQRSDLKEALEKFIEVEKYAGKNNIVGYYIKSVSNIAVINARSGNPKSAIEYFNKVLKITENTDKHNEWILSLVNIGNCYTMMHEYKSAIEFQKNAYVLAKKYKFDYGLGIILNNLSSNYIELKQYSEAKNYALESLKLAEEMNDSEVIMESCSTLGAIFARLNDPQNIITYSIEGVEIAEKLNAKKQLKELYNNLAKAYYLLNDFKQAYIYKEKHQTIKDSLYNEANLNKIMEMQAKYDADKKTDELKIKQLEIDEKNRTLLGGAVIFLIVAGSLITVSILYKNKIHAYKSLVKKNIEIVEAERKIKEIVNKIKNEHEVEENDKHKYKNSTLSTDKKDKISVELHNLMEIKKVYLDKDITIEAVANMLDVSSKYLSQVINETYNTNFSNFINEYRIKEARRLLTQKESQYLSLEAIGENVGFHSKPSFNAAFKKFTGLTPSYYKSSLYQEEEVS